MTAEKRSQAISGGSHQDTPANKVYERPLIIPFGELVKGAGAGCSPGNSAFGSGSNCQAGTRAGINCITGAQPSQNCNTGGGK